MPRFSQPLKAAARWMAFVMVAVHSGAAQAQAPEFHLEVSFGEEVLVWPCNSPVALLHTAHDIAQFLPDFTAARIRVQSEAAFQVLNHGLIVTVLDLVVGDRLGFTTPLPATPAAQAWVDMLNLRCLVMRWLRHQHLLGHQHHHHAHHHHHHDDPDAGAGAGAAGGGAAAGDAGGAGGLVIAVHEPDVPGNGSARKPGGAGASLGLASPALWLAVPELRASSCRAAFGASTRLPACGAADGHRWAW
jgi:hypothetical protein